MYSPRLGRFLQTDTIFYNDDMDLYAYVGNDPINASDPSGREVRAATHPFGVLRHYKVVFIPNNQDRWKNDERFKNNVLPDGRHFATIAAGPGGKGDKLLVSGVNRPLDVEYTSKGDDWYQTFGSSPSGNDDTDIENLLAADNRYMDDLEYAGIPMFGGYNCFGYGRGLLQVSGFTTAVEPPGSFGWNSVVPIPPKPTEKKGSVDIECSPENPGCMK
jgi:hypothetical protein